MFRSCEIYTDKRVVCPSAIAELLVACATANLEKFRRGTPLSEINNSVDGGTLLLAPLTVDANDAFL